MAATKTFSTGEIFRQAWKNWQVNAGLLVGLTVLGMFGSAIPVLGIFIHFYLELALLLTALYSIAGQKVEFAQVMPSGKVFGNFLVGALLIALVSGVSFFMLALLTGGLSMVIADKTTINAVVGALSLVFAVIWVYLGARLCVWPMFIAHKELGPIVSLKATWEMTKDVSIWSLFGFLITVVAVVMVGVLALFVGVFVAVPFIAVMSALLYKKLLDQTPAVNALHVTAPVAPISEILNPTPSPAPSPAPMVMDDTSPAPTPTEVPPIAPTPAEAVADESPVTTPESTPLPAEHATSTTQSPAIPPASAV